MKHAVININLRVQFDYDETRHDMKEASEYAKDLAINPNYNTVEEGVQLTDHEISDVDVDDPQQYMPH